MRFYKYENIIKITRQQMKCKNKNNNNIIHRMVLLITMYARLGAFLHFALSQALTKVKKK